MKTLRSIPSPAGRPRGQAYTELAIVLPLLVLIMLGVVDYGRVFFHFQSVESAATAGAQFGCRATNTAFNSSAIRVAALAQAQDITNCSPTVISVVTNDMVRVTVSARFNTWINWPGLPHQVPVQRTASMRILP